MPLHFMMGSSTPIAPHVSGSCPLNLHMAYLVWCAAPFGTAPQTVQAWIVKCIRLLVNVVSLWTASREHLPHFLLKAQVIPVLLFGFFIRLIRMVLFRLIQSTNPPELVGFQPVVLGKPWEKAGRLPRGY
jgi:hypothetical protein